MRRNREQEICEACKEPITNRGCKCAEGTRRRRSRKNEQGPVPQPQKEPVLTFKDFRELKGLIPPDPEESEAEQGQDQVPELKLPEPVPPYDGTDVAKEKGDVMDTQLNTNNSALDELDLLEQTVAAKLAEEERRSTEIPAITAKLWTTTFPLLEKARQMGRNDAVAEILQTIAAARKKNPKIGPFINLWEAGEKEGNSILLEGCKAIAGQMSSALEDNRPAPDLEELVREVWAKKEALNWALRQKAEEERKTALTKIHGEKTASEILVALENLTDETPQRIPFRIRKGMMVPSSPDANGKWHLIECSQDSVVLLELTQKTTSKGKTHLARVLKQVGPDLHFDKHREVKGKKGEFSFVPEFYRLPQGDARANDPFDILRVIGQNMRYGETRRQDLHAYSEKQTVSIQFFLFLETPGILYISQEFKTGQGAPTRHLEVALERQEQGGAVKILAWGTDTRGQNTPQLQLLKEIGLTSIKASRKENKTFVECNVPAVEDSEKKKMAEHQSNLLRSALWWALRSEQQESKGESALPAEMPKEEVPVPA